MKSTSRMWPSIALFLIAAVLTFIALRVFKPTSQQASNSPQVAAAEMPGLSEGEIVNLPELPKLDGGTISLKDVKEKYLLLVVLSTTCPKCSKDAGVWKDLVTESAKRGVAFYVVSIDTDQERLKRFAQANEFETLPILFDPQNKAKQILKSEFVPQYLLLTSGGKVLGRWDGVSYADTEEKRAARMAQFFRNVPD